MSTVRLIAGFVAALAITASSYAHSVLGWPAMRARLAMTNAPADLVLGLGIGWVFGGACMLAFGAMAFWMLSQAWRGTTIMLAPLRIVGGIYVAFGTGAWHVSAGNPFFAIFVVPGLLLLFASIGSSASLARRRSAN